MPATSAEVVDGVTVLAPSGRIVIDNSFQLREDVRSALEDGAKKILLNLGEVTTVDSSGIGELVSAYTAVNNQGGQLKLAELPRKLYDLPSITKLLVIFEVFDTEEEAVASFS
ncbi:anti-sigma B factor antagonist [Streptomyces sp. TLI_235]|nr:STAS domain-containing protein [Streptomyces sp. TLI_235]PBC70625.1 anti-sigma B factor antagonist [Streptomyces sp. TLI_235]